MNQDNYKAIAEIMKINYSRGKFDDELSYIDIILELADHFEQKQYCLCGHPFAFHSDKGDVCDGCACKSLRIDFNREQFLKDAGVK